MNQKQKIAYRRKLLRLWSSEGRRLQPSCILCGSTKYLNAHHIYEKKFYPSLRYDITNQVILCSACHRFKAATSIGGFHSSPIPIYNWINDNPEKYKYLVANMHNPIDLNDEDILKYIESCILAYKPIW